MRFVDGMDLGALRCRHERFKPEHAACLLSQIAGALDAAHARGLVHRDVKPTNVLVTDLGSDEHLYLTDFGLTKRIADSGGLTASGAFVGTLDYIAPEQLRGDRVDARGDVYALGCVLYELLSGVVPFPREDERAKIFAHLAGRAPAPSALVADSPIELDEVVARAMAKDPDERYLSAGALARAATAAASGRVVDGGLGRSVATGAAATVVAAATARSVATDPARPEQKPIEARDSLDALVSQAAEVIAPLLSEASVPRPHEPTGREGPTGQDVATRILGRLSRYLGSGHDPGASELGVAFRAALADGDLTKDDLATLVSLEQPPGEIVNEVHSVRAKNAFTGNQIDIGGDFVA